MKTRTFTLAVLWLILGAMLFYTVLEETQGDAHSLQEQEVHTGLMTASCLRGRPPPSSSLITVYDSEEVQRQREHKRPEAEMLLGFFYVKRMKGGTRLSVPCSSTQARTLRPSVSNLSVDSSVMR